MKRVSAQDSARISQLSNRLGDRTLRTLLTSESKRLMPPERIANLRAGTGKLSDAERDRLRLVSENANQIRALKSRAESHDKIEWKINRAIRDWVNNGKERGIPYDMQSKDEKEQQLKAIKALRFFGVDPQDKTFYVKKGRK